MNPVAIVSNHPNTVGVPYENMNIDIWGINSGAVWKPRLTALFNLHTLAYLKRTNKPVYFVWLSNLTIPVYSREMICQNSIIYPYEEVYNLTSNVLHKSNPLKFFTSSVAYMIALAILQERPKISLYGIELMHETEYTTQREAYTFWVGFAAGRGIDLEIVGSDDIFDKPLYGEIE